MVDDQIAELRTGLARQDERMNTLNERMSAKQAEYKTDIGNLAAEIGKFAAKSEAEIGKFAAKSEADLSKFAAKSEADIGRLAADLKTGLAKSETDISRLGEKMARRDTWLLLSAMGLAAIGFTILGVVGGLFSLG